MYQLGRMAPRLGDLVEVCSSRQGQQGSPGRSAVYRHVSAEAGFADRGSINNLFQSFDSTVEQYPYRKCLGWRPHGDVGFSWLTYKETARWIERAGAGLVHLGTSVADRVGVYGANCKELMVVMCATQPFGNAERQASFKPRKLRAKRRQL